MSIADSVYSVVGRASLLFDAMRPLILRLRGRGGANTGEYDKTGLVSTTGKPAIWYDDGEVLFAGYESLAHSFWRSQELSLIRKWKPRLESPLADFGCGDGVFSSLIFDRIDYGIDNDPDAVQIARVSGLYSKVVQSTASGFPLPGGSLGSVVTNSVLEHVNNVEVFLREIHRLLRDGGVLLATIPVLEFQRQLAKYFGITQSKKINEAYFHRNLHDPEYWFDLLSATGFEVELVHQYQPVRFSYWYYMLRLCGRHGLGMIYPGAPRLVWRLWGGKLVNAVRRSILGVGKGANVLILARKRG